MTHRVDIRHPDHAETEHNFHAAPERKPASFPDADHDVGGPRCDPAVMPFRGSVVDGASRAGMRRQRSRAWILVAVSVLSSILFLVDSTLDLREQIGSENLRGVVEVVVFTLVLLFLLYGNLVYQLTRLGYLRRRSAHVQASRSELDRFLAADVPAMTVLVPSYKEEVDVVAQTLLSSALQEYPNKRIVLLVDDPPSSKSSADQQALEAMRLLPAQITNVLSPAARQVSERRQRFVDRTLVGGIDPAAESLELADLWGWVSAWYSSQAERYQIADHTDAFFVEHVLRGPARIALRRAEELHAVGLPHEALHSEYRRLAGMFNAEITSFERKRYVNLSHEPNKAMNLNSYIGLLGRSFTEVRRSDGLHLQEVCGPGRADVVVPAAEYVLTLDADSLLAPDYALRLVHHMEQPGNGSIAVIQTPYCAVPGAASNVERIAGATTDIQHILHQGSTHYSATFWVGANAVLRAEALKDIRVVEEERGFPVTRYIQDRTVIEDTESSIDLVRSGWSLYNYPDRLAVSATPPDFGALAIQRGRWANGGLIILPKLVRHTVSSCFSLRGLREGAVRFYYLSSIAGVNLGLLLLFFYPFSEHLQLASPWLPLAAVPYFVVYASDLAHSGYKKREVVEVYALNLALLPVNVAGVCRSISQWVTRKKVPFARTPKVAGRTSVPARYLLALLLIAGYWTMASVFDLLDGRVTHAGFGMANITLLIYGIARFVGLRNLAADLGRPLRRLPRSS